MTPTAEDVFVQHALKGTPQVRGKYYDGEGGLCAIGALHAAMEGHETSASRRCRCEIAMTVSRHYNLSYCEMGRLQLANDNGADWLTLARKVSAPASERSEAS